MLEQNGTPRVGVDDVTLTPPSLRENIAKKFSLLVFSVPEKNCSVKCCGASHLQPLTSYVFGKLRLSMICYLWMVLCVNQEYLYIVIGS